MAAGTLSLASAGCLTSRQQPASEVPHFVEVNPGLYRGGQPSLRGWLYLSSIGVSNVVKLNTETEASDADAGILRFNIFHAPINLPQQLGLTPISRDLVPCVLRRLDQPGTFIHCEHGQDRTGLLVACYRLNRGWSKADAQNEMLALGFHRSLHGLWEFWERYQ